MLWPDARISGRAGLRNSANGTSSNHPVTAPLNRIAEMRVPTMYPTPMSIGEACGELSSIPPLYSTRSWNN